MDRPICFEQDTEIVWIRDAYLLPNLISFQIRLLQQHFSLLHAELSQIFHKCLPGFFSSAAPDGPNLRKSSRGAGKPHFRIAHVLFKISHHPVNQIALFGLSLGLYDIRYRADMLLQHAF